MMEVEGVGGYYGWSNSQFPLLSQKKLSAGLLLLQPHGFSQPYYSVSSKIGYVCEGECIVGLISPEDSKEEVIKLQKGDALPLTFKTVSWWYNNGDSEFKIIFLGEYDDEYTPGEYCGFCLGGFIGTLNGFSDEFIAKSFHMTKTESEKLIKDQSRTNLLIKINEGTKRPHPCNKLYFHVIWYLIGLFCLLMS
uniref:Globulin n=2 Tax=Solanum tuberosum TaxID=4113 RepID=M0ZG12_SOLTU